MARGGYDTTGLHPSSAGYLARHQLPPQPQPVPQALPQAVPQATTQPGPMTYQFQVQPQAPNNYTFVDGAFAPFGIMHPQHAMQPQHAMLPQPFNPQAHLHVTQAMLSWQPLYPQPHTQMRWP